MILIFYESVGDSAEEGTKGRQELETESSDPSVMRVKMGNKKTT